MCSAETAQTAIFNNEGTNFYPADKKKNTSLLHLKNKIIYYCNTTEELFD